MTHDSTSSPAARSTAGNDLASPHSASFSAEGAHAAPEFGPGPDAIGQRRQDKKLARRWKKRRQLPWYAEIVVLLVIALAIATGFHRWIGSVYMIPSESMEPTLHGCTNCNNDRIFVNKVVYDYSDPKPGDVIVFKGPPAWDEGWVTNRSSNPIVRGIQNVVSFIGFYPPDEKDLVKRVIAVGGQTVQCLEGDEGVKVNGKLIDSSVVLSPPSRVVDTTTGSTACGGDYFGPITVPDGNVWVMGDNRTNSADSRFHISDEYQGTIPRSYIIGRVEARIFPLSRIGGVDNPDIQQ